VLTSLESKTLEVLLRPCATFTYTFVANQFVEGVLKRVLVIWVLLPLTVHSLNGA
jgi:hypothetical protein